MSLNHDSPAPPAGCRLRAAAFGCLALALMAGCGQKSQPPPGQGADSTALRCPSKRATGTVSWEDAYRIEPSDVLRVKMDRVVPLAPYRLQVYDVVLIDVQGTPPEATIQDYCPRIDVYGTVELGAAYGAVPVVGMSVDEAREAIASKVKATLTRPEVSVQLIQAASILSLNATCSVSDDGAIMLGQCGKVHVAGKSLADAARAVERDLARVLDQPKVCLDVARHNGRFFYTITQGFGGLDEVARLPLGATDTVLDGLARVERICALPDPVTWLTEAALWIERPAGDESGYDRILPIDWDAIARDGDTSTNYQLMPGDRVFVSKQQAPTELAHRGPGWQSPMDLPTGPLSAETARRFPGLGSNLAPTYDATRELAAIHLPCYWHVDATVGTKQAASALDYFTAHFTSDADSTVQRLRGLPMYGGETFRRSYRRSPCEDFGF